MQIEHDIDTLIEKDNTPLLQLLKEDFDLFCKLSKDKSDRKILENFLKLQNQDEETSLKFYNRESEEVGNHCEEDEDFD